MESKPLEFGQCQMTFICFEPWDGYPDLASETTLNLEEKKNILRITKDTPYQSCATFVFE